MLKLYCTNLIVSKCISWAKVVEKVWLRHFVRRGGNVVFEILEDETVKQKKQKNGKRDKICNPSNAWCPLKGHKYLTKPCSFQL